MANGVKYPTKPRSSAAFLSVKRKQKYSLNRHSSKVAEGLGDAEMDRSISSNPLSKDFRECAELPFSIQDAVLETSLPIFAICSARLISAHLPAKRS